MKVTLYTVVYGKDYERYAEQLEWDAAERFFPGECQILRLPGTPGPKGDGWPTVSATRYRVALNHWHLFEGDWVFQIDADSRIVNPVGHEILAAGVTVTTHPGFPPDSPVEKHPYERRPSSTACVPVGEGRQYHPGAFVGGTRSSFLALAHYVAASVDHDIAQGVHAVWYEESHLNRYLLDHPPALVLDRRYCWWDEQWGKDPASMGARIVHLDKTEAEFEARG